MKKTLPLAAALLLALPVAGHAFIADKGLPVANIGNATFEVVARGGTGNKAYWCAAAQFARDSGAQSNTRLYLVQGPSPSASLPNRTSVKFTTNPQAAGVTPIAPQASLSVDVPGDNLSVVSAQQYCYQGLRRS